MVERILALAAELQAVTIEQLMAKSDLEVVVRRDGGEPLWPLNDVSGPSVPS